MQVDDELEFPSRNNIFQHNFDHIKSTEHLMGSQINPNNSNQMEKIFCNREVFMNGEDYERDSKVIAVKSGILIIKEIDFHFW